MIWESLYWRRDLLRDAGLVVRWAKKPPSERQSVLLEKKIMLAAYSMRKIFEAKKLSTRLNEEALECESVPRTENRMTRTNWHKIDFLFDLERRTQRRVRVLDLLNQIVHSYIFLFVIKDNNKICGFYIASDRLKARELLYVPLVHFVRLMRRVGKDSPPAMSWWIDPGSGEERAFLGTQGEIRQIRHAGSSGPRRHTTLELGLRTEKQP